MIPLVVKEMGLHALLLLLVLAGVIGMLAGALMIMLPHRITQMGNYMSRWIPACNIEGRLEWWINTNKWSYKHHRASGGLLLAGSLWVLGIFITSFDNHRVLAMLSDGSRFPIQLWNGLLSAFVLMGIAGAVFSALLGLHLLFRPSLLREFEQTANRWISTQAMMEGLEQPRYGIDEYVFHNASLVGALLLLGSLYIVGMLLFFWR
jgi:hypothetical protein